MGFNYWNLSYRKKFIRTLWMTPFTFIAIVLIFLYGEFSIGIKIVFNAFVFLTWLIQLLYTYQKSKTEKK